MAKRKKKQFNAPPVGGPLPRGARGSQALSAIMAPLVEPHRKYLKKIAKLYSENSEDYNKAYIQWYSERIHEISDRITHLWTQLEHVDRMGIASYIKGKTDAEHRNEHRRRAIDPKSGSGIAGLNHPRARKTSVGGSAAWSPSNFHGGDAWQTGMLDGIISEVSSSKESPMMYGETSDNRGYVSPDGARKFRKILNEADSLTIWLMKSQRQFTGHPLVATHDDIVGHLKRKIDPNIAHENWNEVFFKHSPFIEMRFQDSPLPSMLIGQQHERASGYLLSVVVDTYNHRESYALKFSPSSLMSFLSGESYERGLDIMEPPNPQRNGGWHYPEASAGSHKKAPPNEDGLPMPFFNHAIMAKFAEEVGKRGYDPEPVLIYMGEMDTVSSPEERLDFNKRPKKERRECRKRFKELLAEMMPEEELDEIILKIYHTPRLLEPSMECPVALDVQAEIRQTLWVSLSLLRDASTDVVKITNPVERREKDEGTSTEESNGGKDYVAPQFRWRIIPKRTRLASQSRKKGNGKSKPAHPRHAHPVTYRSNRYSDELRGKTVVRGEGGISIKGYDGPLPQEILGYEPSPEERAKIEAEFKKQGRHLQTMVKPKPAVIVDKTTGVAPKQTLKTPTKVTEKIPEKTKEQVTPSQHKVKEERREKKLHDRASKAEVKTGYWTLFVKKLRNFFRG